MKAFHVNDKLPLIRNTMAFVNVHSCSMRCYSIKLASFASDKEINDTKNHLQLRRRLNRMKLFKFLAAEIAVKCGNIVKC